MNFNLRNRISAVRMALEQWSSKRNNQREVLRLMRNERAAQNKLTRDESAQRTKLNDLDGYPTSPQDEKVSQ